jgi:hypothetical protein
MRQAAVLGLIKVSNEQMAEKLDLALGEVQQMTTQLREGILAKKAGRTERRGGRR